MTQSNQYDVNWGLVLILCIVMVPVALLIGSAIPLVDQTEKYKDNIVENAKSMTDCEKLNLSYSIIAKYGENDRAVLALHNKIKELNC